MEKKPGRNDPCPCGSGKKYKNCHYGSEAKKTYTTAGKRKFKATLLSTTDKSQSIFQGAQSGAKHPSEAAPFEPLKFKLTKTDYRVKEESREAPFKMPLPQDPSKSSEKPQALPDEFEPTKSDYREEEGSEKSD